MVAAPLLVGALQPACWVGLSGDGGVGELVEMLLAQRVAVTVASLLAVAKSAQRRLKNRRHH